MLGVEEGGRVSVGAMGEGRDRASMSSVWGSSASMMGASERRVVGDWSADMVMLGWGLKGVLVLEFKSKVKLLVVGLNVCTQ